MHPRRALCSQQGTGVAEFEELTRDTHTFSRRVGDLPQQREADGEWDFRPLLHRCVLVCAVCVCV
jgi:hypothetical protein